MAQNFRRYVEKSIGNTAASLPDSGNFDSYDTIVGINLANRLAQQITVSVYMLAGGVPDNLANRYYIVKDAPIPAGSTLQALDGGAKIVVQSGDRLWIVSDTASSLDAWVSAVDAIST